MIPLLVKLLLALLELLLGLLCMHVAHELLLCYAAVGCALATAVAKALVTGVVVLGSLGLLATIVLLVQIRR